MVDETAFENGQISNFKRLMSYDLDLDRVILHTVVHYSPTYTYTPNFLEIRESFCGQTNVRKDTFTDGLCQRFDLNNWV